MAAEHYPDDHTKKIMRSIQSVQIYNASAVETMQDTDPEAAVALYEETLAAIALEETVRLQAQQEFEARRRAK
jgi:hypothetical protein